MTALCDDLTRAPIYRVTVTVPDDAGGVDVIDVTRFGPPGSSGVARSARWLGLVVNDEGAGAVLWYVPATNRTAVTITEEAAGLPNTLGSWPLVFGGTGEAIDQQIVAIDSINSTPGRWEILF